MCETNDPYHFKEKIDDKYLKLDSIENLIKEKKDIIGREDTYIKIELDKKFPKHLFNFKDKYKEWIA